MRQILGVYSAPRPHWVGDGFPVRTMLSHHDQGAHISPFIMLDYAGPASFEPTNARRGVGVHCGECGCFNRTPHPVFLSWFEDVLTILERYNIGFALWNFGGTFGVLDSGRADVAYEDWYGRKLDRKLLALMQKH